MKINTILVFAVGENYAVLVIARALEGIGSSFTSVASKIHLNHLIHNLILQR